jgi:hypothetical protein
MLWFKVEHFFPEWKELVSSMCRQNSSPQTRCNAAKEALVTLKVGVQLTAWIESLGLKELLFGTLLFALKSSIMQIS